jgi:hypothetical protein
VTFSLEELYTSPTAGFAVPASPTQRAICRLIEGRPLADLAEQADVVASFGGPEAIAAMPTGAPLEFDLLSGIRTGKSQLAACRALHASQTVDVSHLAPGEVPRVSVISLDLDKSRVVLDHLVGTMMARPALRRLLVDDPKGDTVLVRSPSGRPIEIACVAGSRAGGSVVARWSAGCVFDEFCRMFGSADGAIVNYDDARRAVLGRLLSGATILSIGSPWAPAGPSFERFNERFGKPSSEHVVVRARADAMNPAWWTPARIERLKQSDEAAHTTDVCAEFADPSETYIRSAEIKQCTRAALLVLPPSDLPRKYICGVDPGTRGNAFSMILLAAYIDKDGVVRYEVAMSREWRGTPSAPLSPWKTFQAIGALIEPYGLPLIVADQHSADAHVDICSRLGLRLSILSITAQNRSGLFEALKGCFASGVIDIPPDRTLANDIASVRRRLTVTGIAYDLPRTGDGRHADSVPALLLALAAMGDSSQARAAARAAIENERRMHIQIMMAGGVSPEVAQLPEDHRYHAQLALANGASVEDLAPMSLWQRLAAARPRDEAGRQLSGLSPVDADAWNKLIGK